jgi:hypothetical protein
MFLSRSSPHLRAAGVGLTGLAGAFGETAWLHLHAVRASLEAICGAAADPHCTLCPLSLALLAAGLAGLASLSASVLPRCAAVEV